MGDLYGLFRGVCLNNNDPEHLGRIQVTCAAIHGDTGASDWAWPCYPPGWPVALASHTFTDHNDGTGSSGNVSVTLGHAVNKLTPAPQDGVWLMFEGGDETKPVWIGTWARAT